MSIIAKAVPFIRERGAGIATEALVNFVLPLLIFDFAKPRLGEVNALIASSGPPIVWSLIEFARKRRVDALSILVLTGIALSLLAFLGGGSARFLQLREKLVTVTIGLVFLGSAAIGRPLIYQLARATIMRRSPGEVAEFESLRDNVHFRRVMMIMTLVWGFGLLAEAAVSAALVLSLSVHNYLIVGPIVGYGTMGALSLWTWWYARESRRKGRARASAEAALKATADRSSVQAS
ncbi:MAG: putative rane protein [Caulobacteraceae bacterium]|nr:putative rane protein [Caulobacteraceae bacterium]